jgi:hypothetical protein
MSDFRVPLDDIRFALRRIADMDELSELPDFAHADAEMVCSTRPPASPRRWSRR